MTAPETSLDEVAAAARRYTAQAVTIWLSAAKHLYLNGSALLRVPIEFLEAEDECLSVGSTTVYFPHGKGAVELETADVVVFGTTKSVKLEVEVLDAKQDPMPVQVRLLLPPGMSSALCSFTLRDIRSRASKRYCLPFGVPGRRR